jgi:phosphosulfolactate synthase (CoM biosynthesis protein A)
MDNDSRIFDFLELAPRSTKPRTKGLTCVADEGDPIPWVRDMLDIWGAYVDSVKFVPASLMMSSRTVEQRVKLYRDFNLGVALDDPMFGIAYYQGKAEQLLRTARDIGFTHCQIDTRQVELTDPVRERNADEDAFRFGAMAKDLGYKLWGEVGQKHEEGDRARAGGGLLNVDGIVSDMKQLLASGCERVFLENRVMRDAIGDYGEKQKGDQQIREIVEQVGQENIYIEIANQMSLEARNCHRFWAVRTFGPDVNFAGGTTLKEVRFVEAIRRGIIHIPGPSKATSRLWVKSLAKNGGRAADDWWTEEYPIDTSVVAKLR